MNDHFMPVGKPAPPRPRRPEAFISLMIQSLPFLISSPVPSQSPRLRAASRENDSKPKTFVNMRSLSSSMLLLYHCEPETSETLGQQTSDDPLRCQHADQETERPLRIFYRLHVQFRRKRQKLETEHH